MAGGKNLGRSSGYQCVVAPWTVRQSWRDGEVASLAGAVLIRSRISIKNFSPRGECCQLTGSDSSAMLPKERCPKKGLLQRYQGYSEHWDRVLKIARLSPPRNGLYYLDLVIERLSCAIRPSV